ncbi:WD40-repeat-containing domain protein [Gorgonomyces haynaldii]|nr:WD40-repeat-containing domain protein [Gorgonomyces haynaldii]
MPEKRPQEEQLLKQPVQDDEMGEFEDAWEDEFEQEEVQDQEMEVEEEEEDNEMVYLPGQELEDGQVLVVDNSAYDMLHCMNCEWPCLSFDIFRDHLGTRSSYPMTNYMVAGSQADAADKNKLYIMKMSSMYKTKHDDDDDDEDSDDDNLDDDPILEFKEVAHKGGVNRVRVMPNQQMHITASMSENGQVYIYDLTQHVQAFDTPGLIPSRNTPVHTIKQHGKAEGYAIDWSTKQPGYLLTGDVQSKIFLTQKKESGFVTEQAPFQGHKSSVEDLQWSPSQGNVFASCSADKTIKIWDARQKKSSQLTVKAHDSDVNVISWSRNVDYLLASGAEDGQFSVWDLRNWSKDTAQPQTAASFKWHKKPISSIEWHPVETSVLAVAGADDQITLWDLALEHDNEEEKLPTNGTEGVQVPPQLLFIHQGQTNVKEVHWHPQIPGLLVSTSFDGFNIFKTINS